MKAPTDSGYPTGSLQRVQKENRSKDDEEEVERDEEALDGGSRQPDDLHPPRAEGQRDGYEIDDWHRPLCRNSESDEQNTRNQDRQYGEESSEARSHDRATVSQQWRWGNLREGEVEGGAMAPRVLIGPRVTG